MIIIITIIMIKMIMIIITTIIMIKMIMIIISIIIIMIIIITTIIIMIKMIMIIMMIKMTNTPTRNNNIQLDGAGRTFALQTKSTATQATKTMFKMKGNLIIITLI